MKEDIKNFIDEITTNFSELYVETFFIRYLSKFDKKEIINNFELSQKMLNKKLIKKFNLKLKTSNKQSE